MSVQHFYIKKREGFVMIEKLVKIAEDSAKRSANSGSLFLPVLHQPKMPKSLIKKDEK